MDNDTELIELRMAAAGMYEHFTTLVEAGFTEDQALQLMGALLAGQKE